MGTAAKFFDPVVGIDVHLVLVPTPAGPVPTPLPHPFVGIVFDPIGAAVGAAIGAVLGGGGPVFVQGLPCGNTGTDVKGYPHFPTPPGVAPAPADPPANEGTLVTGSTSVKFMGSSESRITSMVSTCGFPVSLPTSVCLSVPAGPPVNIGGPEGLDVMAAVTRGIRTKWASSKLHKLAKAAEGSKRSKFICFLTGHPIDVMSGELIAEASDFEIPGLIPIDWERNYRSRSVAVGGLGPGWSHPFDEWIECHDANTVTLHLADGRDVTHGIGMGDEVFNAEERYFLRRRHDHFQRYDIATGKCYTYRTQNGDRHQLTKIANRAGVTITFDYDNDQLVRIIDTAGRQLDVSWRQRRIVAIAHDGRMLVRYEYESGLLSAVTDPLGHAMRYRYRGGVMVEEVHRTGLTFHFEWDWYHPEGWCQRSWGEEPGHDGRIYPRELRYDPQRHVTTVADSRGSWTYYGNALGLVDKQIDPSGRITTYEWSDDCRKVAEADGLGNTRQWVYDEWGNCVEEQDELGRITTRRFTQQHQLQELIDPANGHWKFHHGVIGSLVAMTDPLGSTTHYHHDEYGRLTSIDDPVNRTIRYEYHNDHAVAAISDGEGRIERFGVDRLGRLAWSQDASGRKTTISRDAAGRPLHIRHGDGDELHLRYDAGGNVIQRVDQLGRKEEMHYTGTGQLSEYIDAAGYTVKLAYDGEEDLTHVFNQAGERYYFQRDEAGRIRTEIGFDGKRVRYVYDKAGQLQKAVGPQRGEVTEYQHNGAGFLVKVTAVDPFMNKQIEEFEYDALGAVIATKREIKAGLDMPTNPAAYTNAPAVTVRFERDARGAVVHELQQTGDGPAFSIENRYDQGGMRVQRDTSLGRRVNYEYDNAGEVASIGVGLTSPFAGLSLATALADTWRMEVTRNAGGEEIARSFPGGVRALWKRDAGGRMSERHVLTGVNPAKRKAGSDVLLQQYAWRSAEQIVAIQDLLRGGQRQFSHDVRGNLVQETRYPHRGAAQVPITQYRLADKVGNLFRSIDYSDAEYSPGGALRRFGSNTYEYDDAGRMARKTLADGGEWEYRWSPNSRLLSVKRPDGKTVSFDYDAFGRRTQKRFGGAITSYVWDGNDLVHQQVRRADGSLAPLATWVHEPGTVSPIVQEEGSQRYGIVTDHLGVPQILTNKTGDVAWRAQLDVYGVPFDEDGEVAQPWRYPGQLYDEETGLCYNRHRYYDPETGRYISEDPTKLAGGLTLHGYVHDPLLWVDPLGLLGNLYDIVKYGQKSPGLFNHHNVMDAWAKSNIPGYVSRAYDQPTVQLSKSLHDAAHATERAWMKKTFGKVRGNWKNMTARQMQDLSEKMFDAADVPKIARRSYYKSFNKYVYTKCG